MHDGRWRSTLSDVEPRAYKSPKAWEHFAQILSYFNDIDDDEVPHLYELEISIYIRVYDTLSVNVAATEKNLGIAYYKQAKRALAANDLDRCVAIMELVLPKFTEAVRIYRAINFMEEASKVARQLLGYEELLQHAVAVRAATRG